MKRNKLAFTLAIIAGLLAISNFIYKLVRFGKTDYIILFAGIFFIGFGVSAYFMKKD